MPECAYRYCYVIFEINPSTPGVRKKYCCRDHKLREQWLKWDEKKSKTKRKYTRKNQEARKDASLNCERYRECIDRSSKNGNEIKCYQCPVRIYRVGAFRQELWYVNNCDTDEHSLNLPDNKQNSP